MNECRKCKKEFPNRVTVNGFVKNVSKRKFCLNCSPFNLHNTRDLNKTVTKSLDRNCPKCKESNVKFYQKNGIEGQSFYCIKCTKNESGKRQIKLKEQAVEYKGGCCSKCGYNKYIGALDFHHVNPSEKSFSISRIKNYSFDVIKKELDKCIMLCKNCHTEEHHYGRLA